jgi:hypothetical protein
MIDRNHEDYLFTCTECKKNKPNKEFYKRGEVKRGRNYFSKCSDCCRKQNRKSFHSSIKSRNSRLKRKFNITYEEYLILLYNQNYSCYICDIPEKELTKKLAVDHCHKTGKVRGLLCNKCNTALGLFNDNINILKKAIKYLKIMPL